MALLGCGARLAPRDNSKNWQLAQSRVEITLVNRDARRNSDEGVMLDSGELIAADTVVWCAGMRAKPMTAKFPVERDRFRRLAVDEFSRARNVPNIFAARDLS